jgi:hypothetical protein
MLSLLHSVQLCPCDNCSATPDASCCVIAVVHMHTDGINTVYYTSMLLLCTLSLLLVLLLLLLLSECAVSLAEKVNL